MTAPTGGLRAILSPWLGKWNFHQNDLECVEKDQVLDISPREPTRGPLGEGLPSRPPVAPLASPSLSHLGFNPYVGAKQGLEGSSVRGMEEKKTSYS